MPRHHRIQKINNGEPLTHCVLVLLHACLLLSDSCIEWLASFAQPILDLIQQYTGMYPTLIVGGPEPADGGRVNIIRFILPLLPLCNVN